MKDPAAPLQSRARSAPPRSAGTRVPGKPQPAVARPGVHPQVATLKPGGRVALEARGFQGQVAWGLEAPYGAHLTLRQTATGLLELEMAPDAQIDEIIFIRAFSPEDPRLMARSSVRLLPTQAPPKPARTEPLRPPPVRRSLLGLLGSLLRL